MGAAYDAMLENEGLEKTINSKNRKIREQKKIIIELAEGIVKYFDGDNNYSSHDTLAFFRRAEKILNKENKKK